MESESGGHHVLKRGNYRTPNLTTWPNVAATRLAEGEPDGVMTPLPRAHRSGTAAATTLSQR